MTIVSPATFYRWVREEGQGRAVKKNPKGGQRKPRDVRLLVIEVAKTTSSVMYFWKRWKNLMARSGEKALSINGAMHSTEQSRRCLTDTESALVCNAWLEPPRYTAGV